MELIIEFGDKALQRKILYELSIVARIIEHHNPPLNIEQIIVPKDYIGKINSFQENHYEPTGYGIKSLAKMVDLPEKYVIVISPDLYTVEYDRCQRFFVYLHEIYHVLNRNQIQEPRADSISGLIYTTNLYGLFDEYVANRDAIRVIKTVFAENWKEVCQTIEQDLAAFILILQDERFALAIEEKLTHFQIHEDVLKFLQNIRKDFSEISLTIVFVFSILDQVPQFNRHKQAAQASEFVNEETLALMDYFRQKYEQRDFDLRDGLKYMDGFMANFGTRFDDAMEAGNYKVCKKQEVDC